MEKIKLVVFEGHTLGYIQPEQPNRISILHTSLLKSIGRYVPSVIYTEMGRYRLANEKDFDDIGVCFSGYKAQPDIFEFAY